MKLKLALAASVLASVLSTSAMAADIMPATAAYDWTGVYIGAQVGLDLLHPNSTAANFIQPEATGFAGGLNAQALWQTGNIVLGGVADINFSTTNASAPCFNPAFTCKDGSNMNASVRAKLGFASNNVMFYGTGGWGWADYHGETNNGTAFPASKSLNGWVAGAGLAYALNNNWSVGAEYLHYDLGSANVTNIVYDTNYPVKPTLDTIMLNVSYKF
jgi:outer membrane immunogenic protein